jgi:hypothetical protein
MVKNGNNGETTNSGKKVERFIADFLKAHDIDFAEQVPYQRWFGIDNTNRARRDLVLNLKGKRVAIELKTCGPRHGTANDKILYFPYDATQQMQCGDVWDYTICVVCPWEGTAWSPIIDRYISKAKNEAAKFSTEQSTILVMTQNEFFNWIEDNK